MEEYDYFPKGFNSIEIVIKGWYKYNEEIKKIIVHLYFMHKFYSAHAPLLSISMREYLNPLEITINKVVRLPGIVVDPDVRSQQKFVSPDKYALLRKLTKPVRVSLSIFHELGCGRCVESRGFQHGNDKLHIACSTVFLATTFDRDTLACFFESTPVVLEIHDRDTKVKKEDIEAFFCALEGVIYLRYCAYYTSYSMSYYKLRC
jgi:hypothetical protein